MQLRMLHTLRPSLQMCLLQDVARGLQNDANRVARVFSVALSGDPEHEKYCTKVFACICTCICSAIWSEPVLHSQMAKVGYGFDMI